MEEIEQSARLEALDKLAAKEKEEIDLLSNQVLSLILDVLVSREIREVSEEAEA